MLSITLEFKLLCFTSIQERRASIRKQLLEEDQDKKERQKQETEGESAMCIASAFSTLQSITLQQL